MLQSWWRAENLGVPPGPSSPKSTKPSGSWLPLDTVTDPTLRHRNFYDSEVLALAENRLRQRSWGGIVKEDRLLRSLLSSQPVCFNLFGVLTRHPQVLLEWVRSLGLDAVAIEPTEPDDPALVRIEYAPPKDQHLGSGSAFDACITYRDSAGRRGVVAVETKYAEDLADQKVTADPKYAEATAQLGHWKDTAVAVLNQPVPVQCWQNLLLVQKAVQLRTHGWEHGTFVMTSDGRDLSALRATTTLWGQLHDPEPWVRWSPYQSILAIARAHPETEAWAEWFETRYLDLSPIEGHLLDDPNRAAQPIRGSGDPWAVDAFRSAASLATTYAQRALGTDSVVENLIDADLSAAPTLALLANASHLQDLLDPLGEARKNTQPITAAIEGSEDDSNH
jgi:hypothetical protein